MRGDDGKATLVGGAKDGRADLADAAAYADGSAVAPDDQAVLKAIGRADVAHDLVKAEDAVGRNDDALEFLRRHLDVAHAAGAAARKIGAGRGHQLADPHLGHAIAVHGRGDLEQAPSGAVLLPLAKADWTLCDRGVDVQLAPRLAGLDHRDGPRARVKVEAGVPWGNVDLTGKGFQIGAQALGVELRRVQCRRRGCKSFAGSRAISRPDGSARSSSGCWTAATCGSTSPALQRRAAAGESWLPSAAPRPSRQSVRWSAAMTSRRVTSTFTGRHLPRARRYVADGTRGRPGLIDRGQRWTGWRPAVVRVQCRAAG